MSSVTKKTTIVVTNDDGVESPFLHILAGELKSLYDVRVVAPLTEQSWIGKAISRRRRVNVVRQDQQGIPTWTVEGTPADCVNIALGNLFEGESIAAVVSGVNIGFNASLATVMSSGTVGAALEAALLGVPAVALSKSLPQESFEQLQVDRTVVPPELEESLKNDSRRVLGYLQNAIFQKSSFQDQLVVHNYNFPYMSNSETKLLETELANNRGAGIFKSVKTEGQAFEFRYAEGENMDFRTKTDLNCLSEGHISYTLIDYSRLTCL